MRYFVNGISRRVPVSYFGVVLIDFITTTRTDYYFLAIYCMYVGFCKPKYNIFALGPCRRAFPVAGPTVWNSLPDNVISVTSLSVDRITL